jgi:hypothetical protein
MQSSKSDSRVPCQLFSEAQSPARFDNGAKLIEFTARLLEDRPRNELQDELTRAELSGELTEFYALLLRAIIGMLEDREPAFVLHYLEMAKVAAASCVEQGVVETHRTIFDSPQRDGRAAAHRCLASLEDMCQRGQRMAS